MDRQPDDRHIHLAFEASHRISLPGYTSFW